MMKFPHLPQYPETRPLEAADKELLDGVFARLQPRVSEFTFANLFLFRHAHAYQLCNVEEGVVLMGKGYGGEAYFLPPLGGNVDTILARLFSRGLVLYGADDLFREKYLGDGSLTVEEDRASFDYLYLRRELAELPGNRYHKKKNRINYFTARHEYRVEHYGAHLSEGCLRLVDEWYRVRNTVTGSSLDQETEACREAVALAHELELQGVVITVSGEVKAFALGERLNRETTVCHFEKADPFLEGLAQLVNREFNRILFTDCTFVNREQDLGEGGLREAKLSYHPVELVRKYRAWRG
jgi:hypothetical protein